MKIIILMMTKHGFYEEQGNIMKTALQNIINSLKLQNDIQLYSYIGDNKTRYLDKETNTIHLISPDEYDYMYIKTIEAFEFINEHNFDYDFLVRINTSEFINIKLLYELCKVIKNDITLYKKSYCCQLISFGNPGNISFAPYLGSPVLQGKFMMFSKETINNIIQNKYILYDKKKYPNAGFLIRDHIACVDDICITAVLNILNKDKDFKEYLADVKDLPFINEQYLNDTIVNEFLTICIKSENNLQKDIINKLQEIYISNIDYDLTNAINDNLNIINNPTVYMNINNKHIYIPLIKLMDIYPHLKK